MSTWVFEKHLPLVKQLRNHVPALTRVITSSVVSPLGTITIHRHNVEDVLVAASLFQFSEIETASCEFLKEQLDVPNCLGIEAFAALHGRFFVALCCFAPSTTIDPITSFDPIIIFADY